MDVYPSLGLGTYLHLMARRLEVKKTCLGDGVPVVQVTVRLFTFVQLLPNWPRPENAQHEPVHRMVAAQANCPALVSISFFF